MPDEREVIVECKNIEVKKISTKADYLEYIEFCQMERKAFDGIKLKRVEEYSLDELKELFSSLPQGLKESGLPRYELSAAQIVHDSVHHIAEAIDFLSQFENAPLTIDFQRTRNSRDVKGAKVNSKAARFYHIDEIDIVGACLFSRTMKWEFVFGARNAFPKHKKHRDRYSNRLQINPDFWRYNFLDAVRDLE